MSYLSFCEAKAVRELFPLCSHYVMVFLKRVFEPQELRGWKSCPDSFGLSGERVVQKEALRTRFITWKPSRKRESVMTFECFEVSTVRTNCRPAHSCWEQQHSVGGDVNITGWSCLKRGWRDVLYGKCIILYLLVSHWWDHRVKRRQQYKSCSFSPAWPNLISRGKKHCKLSQVELTLRQNIPTTVQKLNKINSDGSNKYWFFFNCVNEAKV